MLVGVEMLGYIVHLCEFGLCPLCCIVGVGLAYRI